MTSAQARNLALHALVRTLQTSHSDREIRMAATAILRFTREPENSEDSAESAQTTAGSDDAEQPLHGCPPDQPREPDSPRPAHVEPGTPLTPHELVALQRVLPHVSPARFTRKHTPAYWREVLQRHSALPPPDAHPRAAA